MTDSAMKDRDFIEYVVKMLVDNPDDVKVERKIDEMGVLITLDVNAKDMGMVIGREGMTAKALRTLLRVIGARNSARVNLKINEPEGSERPPREPHDMSAREMPAREMPTEPRPVEEKKTLDDVMNDIRL
ncbi:MAG: KH domain-containing protein [Candidatus Moranbacteria bacterium]|nr:KH domain-containing protein [Candidatus Moranbacteria bacterium]